MLLFHLASISTLRTLPTNQCLTQTYILYITGLSIHSPRILLGIVTRVSILSVSKYSRFADFGLKSIGSGTADTHGYTGNVRDRAKHVAKLDPDPFSVTVSVSFRVFSAASR